jgi:hypothetical protein
MAELTAARAEVDAAAAADAARAAAAELEALRASSTGNSISADDDRDNEIKLAAQWAAAHPRGAVAAALTGADALAAMLTEIAAIIGGTTLPPRTGTMVTMGSRPLSGTLVPAVGGLPSPRPTTSSGPQ